jgi:hypothetical protein
LAKPTHTQANKIPTVNSESRCLEKKPKETWTDKLDKIVLEHERFISRKSELKLLFNLIK